MNSYKSHSCAISSPLRNKASHQRQVGSARAPLTWSILQHLGVTKFKDDRRTQHHGERHERDSDIDEREPSATHIHMLQMMHLRNVAGVQGRAIIGPRSGQSPRESHPDR